MSSSVTCYIGTVLVCELNPVPVMEGTYGCPNGHHAQSNSFCSECGAKLTKIVIDSSYTPSLADYVFECVPDCFLINAVHQRQLMKYIERHIMQPLQDVGDVDHEYIGVNMFVAHEDGMQIVEADEAKQMAGVNVPQKVIDLLTTVFGYKSVTIRRMCIMSAS